MYKNIYSDNLQTFRNNEHVTNHNYTMELSGEGSIMAIPDVAVINLGVQTIDEDLKTAQKVNNKNINEVILQLKNIGISEKDIQTKSYNIRKKYEYENGKQIDKGYEVTYILEITLNNINQVGEAIDIAVKSGANLVHNISFEIGNPSYYYQKALNLAIKDSMEKAETIGRQLGVEVDLVPRRIVEENYSYEPIRDVYYLREKLDTQIEPGQNEVSAKVKVIFSYK